MAQEYKLKDISSLSGINNFDKIEAEVEGVQDGKVLLVKYDDKVHAISPKCTHYGAPLKLGVVSPEGRITCPWHGGEYLIMSCLVYVPYSNGIFIACFKVESGDIEDAPAPAALNTFDLVEKSGAVYIRGEESAIKTGQRISEHKCSAHGPGGLVIVGGYEVIACLIDTVG